MEQTAVIPLPRPAGAAALATFLPEIKPEAIEQALMVGNIGEMEPTVRIAYYLATCQSAGLNPMTRPFDLIQGDDGKVQLYPNKGCTEQLRKVHRVSSKVVSRERVDGLYIVTVLATTPDGREEESQGIVPITKAKGQWKTNEKSGKRYFEEQLDRDGAPITVPLVGDALANALMKAETKAKRRATLALCGLGLAEETTGQPVVLNMQTGEIRPDGTRQFHYVDGEAITVDAETLPQDEVIIRGRQAIDDLTGGQAPTRSGTTQLFVTAINQAHRNAGKDDRWIASYWGKMCSRFQVATREVIPVSDQQILLHEVRAYYARQAAAEAEAQAQAPSAPMPSTGTPVDPWRTMLADVLGDVRDADLVRAATGVLEDAEATEATGQAMLGRVLNQLEAQDASDGTQHPF